MRLAISLLLVFGCFLLAACTTVRSSAPAPSTRDPHADPNATPKADPRTALKAMSFNIRYGTAQDGDNHWTRRKDGLFDVLRHEAPDLIGLQEALRFQVDEITAALPHYAAIFAGRDDGIDRGEACAILYDTRRFALADSGTFWLSDTPDHPSNTWHAACLRICTWARLKDRVTGRALYHFNTHLDHMNEQAREKGIALILQRIRTRPHHDPVLLTGDFNDGEKSPTVKAAALELTDTFRAAHPPQPHPAAVGTFNGFKNKTDGEKIDYLLVTPNVEVLKSEIVRTTIRGHNVSDHFPVTATLRLN